MRLAELRGYHLECRLPEPVRNAVRTFATRQALVVEAVADNGLSGWGECTPTPAAVWDFIAATLAPELLGRNAPASERLWQAAADAGSGDIPMLALSAIDMAVWDLRGRAEGVSIAALLGGRLRDRVRAYASGPFMRLGELPYADYARTIEGYRATGFTAVKARIGIDPQGDAAVIDGLRRRFGRDLELMVDVNRGYSRPDAADLMRRLDAAGLLWIEEPIAAEDYAGFAALSRTARTPLATGEALGRLEQFRELLALNAIGVVQPDLYLCGGFTGAMQVAALAQAHQVAYVPHVWGTAINFHASLQLAAVLPDARLRDGRTLPMFEWDRSDNALLRMADPPPIAADGTVAVPDKPGIGIAIDRDRLAPLTRQAWHISA